MGRLLLILAVSVFCFSALACEKSVSETKTPDKPTAQTAATPVSTPSVPKDGNYDGKGEVTKINEELGSVEIDHEKIKDLMPRMRMEFFVRDKSQLKDLKIGDRVQFVIEYKHPQETITSIKKTP